MQVVVSMASRGLRCIAMTHRDLPLSDLTTHGQEFFADAENLDKDLVLDAIVGIKDPVRKEVITSLSADGP